MTRSERIRIERGVEALIAQATKLRCLLEIEGKRDAGEFVSPVWSHAMSMLDDRIDLTRAMAEACGDGDDGSADWWKDGGPEPGGDRREV